MDRGSREQRPKIESRGPGRRSALPVSPTTPGLLEGAVGPGRSEDPWKHLQRGSPEDGRTSLQDKLGV